VRAEHITKGGITRLAAAMEPEQTIWGVRGDGQLVALTWSDDQQVRGFSRTILGGADAAVESIAVIPAPDGSHDQLWMSVRRTLGGAVVRTIERMERLWQEGQDQASGYFMDCGATYDGAPATIINGLTWLAGETVQVVADGAIHPDLVVSPGGTITLQRPASTVHVGFGFGALVETMRLTADVQSGSGLSKIKRVVKLALGLSETLGIRVRRPGGRNEVVPFRSSAAAMDQAVPLFSGEKLLGFPGTYDREARVIVESWQPLPFTLQSIGPRMTVSEGE
jgi:hypothetical protein